MKPQSTDALIAAATPLKTAAVEAGIDEPLRRALASALRAKGLSGEARQVLEARASGHPISQLSSMPQIECSLKQSAEALLQEEIDGTGGIAARLGVAKALVAIRAHGKAILLHRSVLSHHPGHAVTTSALLDLLVARGKYRQAERVLAAHGGAMPAAEHVFHTAQLALRTGAPLSAIAQLEQVIAAGDAPPRVLSLRLAAELSLGDAGSACALADGYLGVHPDNKGLWIKAIEARLQARRLDEAFATLQEAFSRFDSDPMVLLEEVRLLRARGDADSALERVRQLEVVSSDPRILMEHARILRGLGRSAEAEQQFQRILEVDPGHRQAHLGYIDCAFDAADGNLGLLRVEAAESVFPNDTSLLLLKASGLGKVGRLREAEALLSRLKSSCPEHPGIRVELARLLQSRGAYTRARSCLRAVLENTPGNVAAILLHSEILATTGGSARAESWLSGHLKAQGTALSDLDGRLLLALCELSLSMGNTDRAGALLRLQAARLQDDDVALSLRVLLAGLSLRDEEVSATALERLLAAPALRPIQALAVLDALRSVADTLKTERLAIRLGQCVPSETRAHYDIGVVFRLEGPIAALAVAKRRISFAATWGDALLRARLLEAAGLRPLALRYLNRATRVWPDALALKLLYAGVAVQIGSHKLARGVLDDLEHAAADERVAILAIRARAEAGQQAQALVEIEALAKRTCSNAIAQQGLRLTLAAGDLEGAERFAARLRSLSLGVRSFLPHFQSSMFGGQLNELRILHRLSEEADAGRYFYPAKALLDNWQDPVRPEEGAGGTPIPRRIWQYWDTGTAPPMVAELMAEWQVPGFRYERFDFKSARAFLANEFGKDFVTAFRLASHKAEAADFFRLCLLLRKGGVYVDADDRLIGRLEQLLAGRVGCVLFREPYGAIANNVILSSPGHPVLAYAVDMAFQSLIGRENDNTWSKTGPGLLTRAVARAIATCPDALVNAGLEILPQSVLAPVIGTHLNLPYKATSAYWNWSGARALPGAVDALLGTSAA